MPVVQLASLYNRGLRRLFISEAPCLWLVHADRGGPSALPPQGGWCYSCGRLEEEEEEERFVGVWQEEGSTGRVTPDCKKQQQHAHGNHAGSERLIVFISFLYSLFFTQDVPRCQCWILCFRIQTNEKNPSFFESEYTLFVYITIINTSDASRDIFILRPMHFQRYFLAPRLPTMPLDCRRFVRLQIRVCCAS